MTSTIKVNTITTESGSTLTIGGCGKTVALASGASQTGFGRTGTVDWQTGSIKTATFTAVSGEGYFCNTAGGAFEMDLPAGSAGAIVSVQDYNNTFDTENLTIDPNGSEKINGGTGTLSLSTEGQGLTLVYIDSTVGWRTVQDNDFATAASVPIQATGGTISSCGTDRIHTFTGPGTFQVTGLSATPADNQLSYIVVAGGGGGGSSWRSGGGGAGGFREDKSPTTTYTASPLEGAGTITATITSFPIVVGAGGAGGGPNIACKGAPGSVSTFSTITSTGGGIGGEYDPSSPPNVPGTPGGSGGGGGGDNNSAGTGGTGNTPPVSPPQGQNGGTGVIGRSAGAGGGGAGAVGTPPGGVQGDADGGAGVGTGINPAAGTPGPSGSLKYFAGGGGGGDYTTGGGSPNPAGGVGGGGAGGYEPTPGTYQGQTSGTANTGGGGGGKAGESTSGLSGSGGSGVVIIRYKFQ